MGLPPEVELDVLQPSPAQLVRVEAVAKKQRHLAWITGAELASVDLYCSWHEAVLGGPRSTEPLDP